MLTREVSTSFCDDLNKRRTGVKRKGGAHLLPRNQAWLARTRRVRGRWDWWGWSGCPWRRCRPSCWSTSSTGLATADTTGSNSSGTFFSPRVTPSLYVFGMFLHCSPASSFSLSSHPHTSWLPGTCVCMWKRVTDSGSIVPAYVWRESRAWKKRAFLWAAPLFLSSASSTAAQIHTHTHTHTHCVCVNARVPAHTRAELPIEATVAFLYPLHCPAAHYASTNSFSGVDAYKKWFVLLRSSKIRFGCAGVSAAVVAQRLSVVRPARLWTQRAHARNWRMMLLLLPATAAAPTGRPTVKVSLMRSCVGLYVQGVWRGRGQTQ